LKLLQETYLGKVKMIYIDPPYNTGNDFIYEDDFAEDVNSYIERSNQKDEAGNRLVANTETNGRFHSDWLSMVYSRIKLAERLLSDDGAIFISIDDNEYDNLRKICDEIFGTGNFVATIIWQKVFSPKNTAAYFSEDHDYIVVYAKNKTIWKPELLPRSKESEARYKNPDNDSRGPWLSGAIQARNYYSKGQYEVSSPGGAKYSNPKGTFWRFSQEKFNALDRDNRIWWGKDKNGVPRLKRFLSEVKDGVVPQTLWKFDEVGHTQEAKEELLKYVTFQNTENVFNSVKPSRLIQKILKIGTKKDANDIVLDFFGGSGPTAQALLNQNALDAGNRRFILVQIGELLPKPESGFNTIADFIKSRVKNVGVELAKNHESLDIGFRSFRVESSNMADVHYNPDSVTQSGLFDQIENVKKDRTEEDLLFQVMLDWGVDLTLPIRCEIIDGNMVFFVAENTLVACFDSNGKITDGFLKKIAEFSTLRLVFRDSGFASDSAKINVEQVLKQLSPITDVKSI
jgi:adenine-specific DNA-methyltransferase